MKVVPVLMLLATLLLMAASTIIAVFVCFHQSTAHLPCGGACAIVAGLVLVLVACTMLGWALYNDKSTAAIDREGRRRNGSKGQHDIKEQTKGLEVSKPSGLWGLRHIWAFCLALAAFCDGILQAAMAALSWLVGRHDFYVDDVTEECISRSSSKPDKKRMRRNKKVSKGDSGIREAHKGPGISKPGGLWGIKHIWAFCLFLANYCIGVLRVARAAASWLTGIDDPFEDINTVCAIIAEHHKPLGTSNDSCHVTGGIWGFRHLRIFCCCICAALMASVKATMAASSWLVGCRNFFVDNVTQGSTTTTSSSSSSAGSPTAPKASESKEEVPNSADGKRPSSSTINVSADATDGSHPPKQGPARSGKKKNGKKKQKKGPESGSTKAAGDEAAKPAEKEREEEVDENNMFKVAGKSRGNRGKKGTAAGSSAPLSIKGTVQTRPELITGNILVRILLTVLEKALLLPRWQRMDYQTSFSTLYSIIPDWMLNQYGKHPATVSPTAAFVMLDGLLGRKKRSYADLVAECNKAGMADSLELLCRAMVASEMVQQQGSQKLLAELKTAMPGKHRNMSMQQLCKTFVLPLSGSAGVPNTVHNYIQKSLKKSLKLCLQDVREF